MYLWSNIGKLGFLKQMIVKKTNRKTFKSGDSELAKIPYPLSEAVLDKIKEKESGQRKRKVEAN